jgi:hypothetical protein
MLLSLSSIKFALNRRIKNKSFAGWLFT